jgi:predicted nucleotidyltransferase
VPALALPAPVAALAADLAALPGVVAVVLGGSRATAAHRPDSDWDLGLYYRGERRPLDPEDVRALGRPGHVSRLGEWGPIVNGGAWLTADDAPVDVLFRDLDVVESWLEDARGGRFEVLRQNGYLVGAPTYLPVGELAVCRLIAGTVPRPSFPDALAERAPGRWLGRAAVSLTFAASHARAGDAVCCAGMLADAALCADHARLAARREWVARREAPRRPRRARRGAAAPRPAGRIPRARREGPGPVVRATAARVETKGSGVPAPTTCIA